MVSRPILLSQYRHGLNLAAIPTFARKAIESVAIVITAPVSAMFITIRTAIDWCVPEVTDRDGWNIDPHSQVRVCFCRNAGTHTCNRKCRTHSNE